MEDTIVIAGTPRSGTTLLLEVFRETPGYKALNEPLLMRYTRRRYGFPLRPCLRLGDRAPVQRAFLGDALCGRLGPEVRWSFRSGTTLGQLAEHRERKKLVVKFCRVNRMLHWMADEFPIRGMILSIRHPCSVVSSMMKYGTWEHRVDDLKAMPGGPFDLAFLPTAYQERFAPLIERISTRWEALALMWCLDHYMAIFERDTYPWVLSPYERIVTEGASELKRLAHAVGVEATDRMIDLLFKPSSSTTDTLRRNPREQLSKWKQNLSTEQVDAILRVVDEAGLGGFYSRDPEPDYDRLNRIQRPAFRWETPSGLQGGEKAFPVAAPLRA